MPTIPEITIQSGNTDTYIDFMRSFLRDAARPDIDDQDPAVVARCPDVLQQTLDLIFKFAEPGELVVATPSLITPRIGYKTPEGHLGCIQLAAAITLLDPEVPEFDLVYSHAELQGGGLGDHRLRPMIVLHNDRIYRDTSVGPRAGSQGDLNFLQTKVENIQAAAFPKDK